MRLERAPRLPGARRIAMLLLAGALAGCRRETPGDDFQVEMRVTPSPPVVGAATVDLRLADAAGAPVRGAAVKLEGTMTHPGMRPSFAEAEEAAPGTYRSDLELTMAGDWVILVEARLASGSVVRRTLPLAGVRAR